MIRISQAGACPRRIQLEAWGVEGLPYTEMTLRAFEEGNLHEKSILDWAAKEYGFEVTDQQREVKIYDWLVGHIDGIGRKEGQTPVLLEAKTLRKRAVQEMREKGVYRSHYQYYVQVQLYLHALREEGIKEAMLIARDKETPPIRFWDHYVEVIHYDPDIVHRILTDLAILKEKIERKIEVDKTFNPDTDWHCRWCPYLFVCYPDWKKKKEDMQVREDLAEAVAELQTIQEQIKELGEKEKAIKEELMAAAQEKPVAAGQWVVRVEERRQERFDTKLARQELPQELLQKLLKINTYQVLKIEEV